MLDFPLRECQSFATNMVLAFVIWRPGLTLLRITGNYGNFVEITIFVTKDVPLSMTNYFLQLYPAHEGYPVFSGKTTTIMVWHWKIHPTELPLLSAHEALCRRGTKSYGWTMISI